MMQMPMQCSWSTLAAVLRNSGWCRSLAGLEPSRLYGSPGRFRRVSLTLAPLAPYLTLKHRCFLPFVAEGEGPDARLKPPRRAALLAYAAILLGTAGMEGACCWSFLSRMWHHFRHRLPNCL